MTHRLARFAARLPITAGVLASGALVAGAIGCTETPPTAASAATETASAVVVSQVDEGDASASTSGAVPAKFGIVTRIVGAGSGNVREPLAGARVTLTLLPARRGDALPTGVEPYTEAESVGTVVTDSSGFVRFYNIDVTRYRIDVRPPDGAQWKGASLENAPSTLLLVNKDIVLGKR